MGLLFFQRKNNFEEMTYFGANITIFSSSQVLLPGREHLRGICQQQQKSSFIDPVGHDIWWKIGKTGYSELKMVYIWKLWFFEASKYGTLNKHNYAEMRGAKYSVALPLLDEGGHYYSLHAMFKRASNSPNTTILESHIRIPNTTLHYALSP